MPLDNMAVLTGLAGGLDEIANVIEQKKKDKRESELLTKTFQSLIEQGTPVPEAKMMIYDALRGGGSVSDLYSKVIQAKSSVQNDASQRNLWAANVDLVKQNVIKGTLDNATAQSMLNQMAANSKATGLAISDKDLFEAQTEISKLKSQEQTQKDLNAATNASNISQQNIQTTGNAAGAGPTIAERVATASNASKEAIQETKGDTQKRNVELFSGLNKAANDLMNSKAMTYDEAMDAVRTKYEKMFGVSAPSPSPVPVSSPSPGAGAPAPDSTGNPNPALDVNAARTQLQGEKARRNPTDFRKYLDALRDKQLITDTLYNEFVQ